MRTLPLVILGLFAACRSGAEDGDSAAASDTATPSASSAAQSSGAWWVTWETTPRDSVIEGLPLVELDPTWTAATPLSFGMLPAGATGPATTFDKVGAHLSLDGDFNSDSRPDRVLVGVYRTRSGETGRFVAILTRAAPGRWTRAWIATIAGGPGFSAILPGEDGTGLTWVDCFECDSSVDVKWTGTDYEATATSCCDDEPTDTAKSPPPVMSGRDGPGRGRLT